MKARPFSLIVVLFLAFSANMSVAQDVHIPERNMPDPVPSGVPEAVELTGKALSDISNKITEKFAVPPAVYMSFDPLSGIIMAKTQNGPTVFTNRNVDFIFGKKQDGSIGLFSNFKGEIEDRAEAMKRPFVIDQMSQLKGPVVYKAPNEKYRISVFVEPTCGYCYKLHSEMDQYHSKGITFVYYPFPIYGEYSEKVMEGIWSLPVSERAQAVTQAKEYANQNRNKLRSTPVDELLREMGLPEGTRESRSIVGIAKEVGSNIGVAGTPALVLESGQVIGGYLPAEQLISILEKEK
jgi:thiol:disulfide interchange protein DsbC